MALRQQAEKLHQMIRDSDADAAKAFLIKHKDIAQDICALVVPRDGASMHVAARCGLIEILSTCLNYGVDINQRISEGTIISGYTPLHIAIKYDRLETVEWLLGRGADPNIAEADGMASLHIACQQPRPEIVMLLLDHGAVVNAVDNRGLYPLHTSILRSTDVVSNMLIYAGADTNVADKEGQTPLHYSSEWDSLQTASDLIHNGADVNARDLEGRTALHVAAEDDMFNFLVRCGADPTKRDRRGRPPRDGFIDLESEEVKNIDRALSRHLEKVSVRKESDQIEYSATRVFSPGPPIPEAELRSVRKNMLSELTGKVPKISATETLSGRGAKLSGVGNPPSKS